MYQSSCVIPGNYRKLLVRQILSMTKQHVEKSPMQTVLISGYVGQEATFNITADDTQK